jgi:hypothetical protein
MRVVHCAALFGTVLGCSGQRNSDWLALISSSPACTATPLPLPPSWNSSPLGRSAGEIRLPATFHPMNGSGDQTLWVGYDSSSVAYFESTEPGGGIMTSGSSLFTRLRRPSHHAEGPCRSKVGHHEAVVMTFQDVDSARTDTVFGIAMQVELSMRRYAGVFVLTPSSAMRDSLLRAVTSLQWNSK